MNDTPPPSIDPGRDAKEPSGPGRLGEVAALFTRLGFTAFGGPAAHVAMMEDEVVRRRRWLDRQHFLDLVATLNFIPGPNSTELAIHLGLIRAGRRGLVVAGVCFITPAVLIILPLAWAYVRFGGRADLPGVQAALRGISAAVVSIIFAAGWRFARTAIRDRSTAALAAATVVGEFAIVRWAPAAWHVQPELVLLPFVAVAAVCRYAPPRRETIQSLPAACLPFAPLVAAAGAAAASPWWDLGRLAFFFLKVGATLFGSGYVLVSYLRNGLVDGPAPWLTQQQLLDAVAVGQFTPGPLLTTATFIGYLCGQRLFGSTAGGAIGGVVATVAIFFPAFVLVAAFGHVLPRLRQNRHVRAALDGVNAAVVAMVFTVAVRLVLGRDVQHEGAWLALAAVCLIVLLRWNVNSTWLVIATAAIGGSARLVGLW